MISDVSKNEKKKTRNEYIMDFTAVTRAMARTIAFSFKVTPFHSLAVAVGIAISATIPFVQSFINSRIIDELIRTATTRTHISNYIVSLVALGILMSIVSSLIERLGGYFDYIAFTDFSREFDKIVTTKFAYLEDSYYESPETHNLLTKVRENYGGKPLNFFDGAYALLRYTVEILSSFIIIVTFSPLLLVLMIATTAPQFVNNIIFGRRNWTIWDAKGEVRRDYNHTRSYLSNYQSLHEIRIFGLRKYLLDRIFKLYTEFQNEQKKVENKRTIIGSFLDVVDISGMSVAFVVLILKVVAGAITIGSFSFYVSTLRSFQSSISRLFIRFSKIYEDGLFMVDIYKFLDLEKRIIPGSVVLLESQISPTIEINDLKFKYPGREEYAIDGITTTINPGEHIAIVGENGAGKTTLIKLLMRFYDITEGEVDIDGIHIKDLDLDSWYKKVGAIFQDFNNYHFDAKTNIAAGDITRLNDFDAVIRASKKSGAHEFIEGYENKYDQILSRAFEGGMRPSTGQWQRIALARAFFKDAPILILDEPTSAIDPKAEFEIFENLFEFTKGKTVIIISHRFSTVRNAQRILVLNKGKVIEEGSHEHLLSLDNGVYKTAFELQKKGYE